LSGAPPPGSNPARKLPLITPDTEAFWTGGKDGTLLIQRCSSCHRYQHPPLPLCPKCRTETMTPVAVSGRGTVKTCTVNQQQWVAGEDSRFVFAAIELAEQKELYVFSNVLGPPQAVRSGLPVSVEFEQHEDVWLPLFRPMEAANGA
jgi:uncharacterized protein